MTTFTITLNDNDIGQILDGLRERFASWDYTAEYLETGYSPDDSMAIEECGDADEAHKIAEHYADVIDSIEKQMDAQRTVRQS